MLLPVVAVSGEDEFVYVLHSKSGTVSAVDPVHGRIVATVSLSLPDAEQLFPTPGGKYVFVSFADSSTLAVVDAETHEQVRTVGVAGGTPVYLAFSPMGGTVYVAYEGSRRLGVYTHARGRLTTEDSFAFGAPAAPILFNRRGTRFYRADGGSLRIGYVKNRETIATVEHPGSAAAYVFAPDFRFLWGLSGHGSVLVVVDERRERVVETIRGSFGEQIVFNDRGSEAYLLDSEEQEIVVFATRRVREKRRMPLPAQAGPLAMDGSDRLWVGKRGTNTLLALDAATGWTVHSMTLSAPVDAVAVVGLKPGQGFACF